MGSKIKMDLGGARIGAMQVGDDNVQQNVLIEGTLGPEDRENLRLVAAALGDVGGTEELARELQRFADAEPERVLDVEERQLLSRLTERAKGVFSATERGLAIYDTLPEPLKQWIDRTAGLAEMKGLGG